MEYAAGRDARERILSVSIRLFSEKGFDAAHVSEIADAAGVNKALIYYYFKSKEDILDCLVHSLFENAASIVMDFIHANIVQMIKDGLLDIEPDRLHFVSEEAIAQFMKNARVYYERVLDYAVENRAVIRILMLESLKNSKHHFDLFRLLDFVKESDNNPIFKTISDADKDFTYTDNMVLFNFFYSIIPMICFAAYFDDFKTIGSLNETALRSAFLQSNRIITDSLISGSDILLRNNKNA